MSDDRVPERYSRISRRMWGDDKFRALSAPTANAQDLWIYLLTGSHCGRIPGLFVLGPLYLAERLRWSVEDTHRCFQEILDQGLAQWDPVTLLCWLPNAVRHNEPANPNVLLGRADEWRGMPECRLLGKVRRGMRRQLEDISPAFAAAFDKMAGKPSRKPCRKPLGKGSGKLLAKGSGKQDPDHDRDQEQEQKIPPLTLTLLLPTNAHARAMPRRRVGGTGEKPPRSQPHGIRALNLPRNQRDRASIQNLPRLNPRRWLLTQSTDFSPRSTSGGHGRTAGARERKGPGTGRMPLAS
jgi:hypothetical protein